MSTATATFTTNIAAATDTESTRYALSAVAVYPGGVACATDGRALACVMADVEGISELKLVPRGVFAKPTKKKPTKVELNGRAECNGKVSEYMEGRFPKVSEVLKTPNSGSVAIALDVALLQKVASAINQPGLTTVTLILDPNKIGEQIAVLPSEESYVSAVGVIMPLHKEGNPIERYTANLNEVLAALPE